MSESITTYISVNEIFSNCFSSSCLKNAVSGKINNDLYMVHLSWDAEGLPFGDQHVWLLYSPTSSKFITNILDKIRNIMENLPGMINVELEEVTLFTIPELIILCDSEISFETVSLDLSNGVNGHIGWLVGQGRSFNADDNKVVRLIHLAISNCLMNFKELENDPFLLEGMKKILELRTIARKILNEKK